MPPSVSKHEEILKNQMQPDERVANDRPLVDVDYLPIALSYHGFGRFLDVANGASLDDALDIDINWRKFEDEVNEYMNTMNLYYKNELARNKVAIQRLDAIFACYTGNQMPLMRAAVHNKRSTDGHVIGALGTIELVVELRNELIGTQSEPIIEICGYYTQSLLDVYPTAKDIPHFLFPALGIVIMGQY